MTEHDPSSGSEPSNMEGSGAGEPSSDPFDTVTLRQSVLHSWEASPTRFREDANAEEDLRLGGYRDRLLVELAQNAADAAGADGVLRVELVERELRAANTGAALSAAGVAALASLRASAKRGEPTVGRFGVGFAAVLAVSDEPRVVSTSGSVGFSAARSRAEAGRLPGAADELAERGGSVPILRLVWPVAETPPEGCDTEVRLPLRDDVDAEALFDAFAEQAPDLLLALPALTEIRLGARTWRRRDLDDDRVLVSGPDGENRWQLHRCSGQLAESAMAGLGVEAQRAEWWVCWAVPLDADGVPLGRTRDVLHAPTPTDERLSLPARLLASVPMEPDRRRVSASAATDAVLVFAAEHYPELVAKVAPEHRALLVPVPGFPASDVDDKLRQAVLDRLRVASWLPAADGHTVAGHEAKVLDFESTELVELLREAIPGLLIAQLSETRYRRPLAALEVHRVDAAGVVEAVTGLSRSPSWWYRLYSALAPLERVDARMRDELTALPVPLADDRTAIGVRDVLLSDESDPAATLSTLDIAGLRIVHPEAAHPLLEKLGAHRAGPDDLLDSPALIDAVERSVADARAGMDVRPLAEAVLGLAEESRPRHWLRALALPDADGEFRRADELLLPDAAMLDILDSGVIGEDVFVLDVSFAARWPAETLRSIGVLDSFAVHIEEEPTQPPESFPDAEQWWNEQEAKQSDHWPPARFIGIRDLDLVADTAWPRAIRLLCRDSRSLEALREPNGYTGWWIARFAILAGHPPRFWRLPEADDPAGLYDPVPAAGLETAELRLVGVREELEPADTDDARDLISRLGNQTRSVRAGIALRAHRVLADAVAGGVIDPSYVNPPGTVRSISGAVVSADRAVVLDEPWLLGVLDAPLVVAGGSPDQFDAEALAELFDLPLASEESPLRVRDDGRAQAWSDVSRVPAACELLGVAVPAGEVRLHDRLVVRAATEERRVHWWVDGAGAVHAERTADGLGRALAWAAGRWAERFALSALLADPEATTLLR